MIKLKGGGLIIPQTDVYRMSIGNFAMKIGDTAEIEIGDHRIVPVNRKGFVPHIRFLQPKRVRVILLSAEDGSLWLVKCPTARARAGRYSGD